LFIFFGGGHNDSADNGVYAVRVGLDTPTAVVLMAPSSSAQIDRAYYNDGKPTSRHTYGSLVYHPGANGLISPIASATYGQALILPNMDRFNLATNTWDPQGTWASQPSVSGDSTGMSSCVDNSGNIYMALTNASGDRIMKWTPTPGTYHPGTWSVFATTQFASTWSNKEKALVYDPTRNRIIYFGSSGYAAYWNLATGAKTAITFIGPSAGSAPGKTWSNYCIERDSFFGYVAGTSTTILECRASDFYVSTVSITGTGPSFGGSPTPTSAYNRLKLDNDLGIVMLQNNYARQNLFAFRYK